MSVKFVVSHLDQQMGPFDEQQLKEKWSKGELLPIDYVYDEAKADWILMAERFEWAAGPAEGHPPPIKPALAKKTPPAPPPPLEITGATVVKEWRKAAGTGAKVKLVDGVGEIDLSPLPPGQVELVLQESSSMLKLQEPLRVSVRPAEPEEIVWAFPNQQTVGQDCELLIKAVDKNGMVCTHYNDEFTLHITRGDKPEVQIPLRGGQAAVKLSNTIASTWTMSLKYTGPKTLRLPENKTLEWQPGPAARLILDGPQQLLAGSPLKVQVKAVDAYGNLAKTFQGTVILEVKAS